MSKKNIPLPTPKPWIRGSVDIIAQASRMMGETK